jgi:hypothetical protein
MRTIEELKNRYEVIRAEFADIRRYSNRCWPGLVERWSKNLCRKHNYWCNLNQLKLKEFGKEAREERNAIVHNN